MRIQNKLKIVSILSMLLLLISTSCLAVSSNKDVKMELVENNVCTIKINEFATFEKKLINYDLENKELTIQLKVSNTPGPSFDTPAEIMLVIDNSESMKQREVTPGSKRLNVVVDSAKKFATELLKNENAKVGVVKFSTGDNEGTLSDATLLTRPTSNSTTVLNAIDSVATESLGPRTNIDAGLQIGSQNFSNDNTTKYLVLLTDGVPNAAVGGPILRYSGEVASKTKATLTSLKNAGVNVYTMMTGIDNSEEPTTGMLYADLAAEIFGTSQNPTAGKYYFVSDTQIEKTICETILNDITHTVDSTLTDLEIYDYFPQEIVDNFNFSYVTRPTKGTISESIDTQNNRIVWHIDELGPTDSATVSYKLTLKDTVDDAILSKILKTNAKVDITSNEESDKTSDVSPKIRLTKPASTVTVKYIDKSTNKPLADDTIINGNINDSYKTERKKITGYQAADPEPTNKEGVITKDPITVIYYYSKIDTPAPTPIPQAGEGNMLILAIGSIFVVSSMVYGLKLYKIKNK